MAKIGITETVLRDAHQSLIATRMRTDGFSRTWGCPSMQPTATFTCVAKKASATNSSA